MFIRRVWALEKRNLDELERTLGTRLLLLEFTDQVAAHLEETLQGTSYPFFLVFTYRVFSHDATSAILVSQNNETAAMLVSQTNPVGVELFKRSLVPSRHRRFRI